jgi:serine/threonine protein kinase
MLAFVCPHCGIRLHIEERWAGQPLRCGHCQGVVVTTPLSSGAVVPPLSSPRPAATPNVATLPPPAPAASHVPAAELHADIDLGTLLAPPQAADELGRLGRYRVLQVLGSGGMGVVFRAEDVVLRRPVALKVLLPVLAANPGNRQRFLREAQAAAKLEHDHVVTIYEVDEVRGVPYLAMQLLQGETLEARLRRLRRLPVAEVVRIGQQTALALAVAHERGLVHRDIKPANIFLEGAGGRVKLLDFGLARGMCDDVRLTQSGAMIGSPGYMAPEQVRGGAPQPGSDLFSLGCVLYRCCTARLPFQGPDALAILAALATDTPPAVDALNPEVPRPLAALLMQLLARDPSARPPSAAAVSAALAAVEQGAPAAWVPPPPPLVRGDGSHLLTPLPMAIDSPACDTVPLDANERDLLLPLSRPRVEKPIATRWLLLGLAAAAALVGLFAVGLSGVVWWSLRSRPSKTPLSSQEMAVEKKVPVPPRWTVLLRSDDPTVWNSDSAGERFAIPLKRAPDPIRFLRLRRMDTREALVLPLTRKELDGVSFPNAPGEYRWNGTNRVEWGGRHLGIAEGPRHNFPAPAGIIVVAFENWDAFAGSGFGHKCFRNDTQYHCWRGKEIPRTVFEIAVTNDPLTPDEQRSLLPRP